MATDRVEALREAAQRGRDAGLSHGQDVLDLLDRLDALQRGVASLRSTRDTLARQRDEARAERDRLRRAIQEHADQWQAGDDREENPGGGYFAELNLSLWEALEAGHRDSYEAMVATYQRQLDLERKRLAEARAEVERLKEQVRCGHTPWPCSCGYRSGMCGGR